MRGGLTTLETYRWHKKEKKIYNLSKTAGDKRNNVVVPAPIQ